MVSHAMVNLADAGILQWCTWQTWALRTDAASPLMRNRTRQLELAVFTPSLVAMASWVFYAGWPIGYCMPHGQLGIYAGPLIGNCMPDGQSGTCVAWPRGYLCKIAFLGMYGAWPIGYYWTQDLIRCRLQPTTRPWPAMLCTGLTWCIHKK